MKYFKKKLKFRIADGRHVGKYRKCRELPTNGPIWAKLGWSHDIMSPYVGHDAVAMAMTVA